MRGGASSNPCSDIFGGTAAFSEPETRAIREFYETIARETKIFISLHAFGQYLLIPYGHTEDQSHNHNNLVNTCLQKAIQININTFSHSKVSIGKSVINAIQRRFNTDYVLGSVANVMCKITIDS